MNKARKLMAGWVAAIADNVKNPIASVTATLDQVEDRLDDPAAIRASVATVRERLAALNEYVTELAGFARPVTIETSRTSIRHIIDQAVRAARLPESCQIDRLVADTTVLVDEKLLTHALRAIIRNAYEAVDSNKSPKLKIETARRPDGTLVVRVEDNGIGLSTSVTQEAFEPFFTTKEAGTGLGLTIARKYVAAHDGTITISPSTSLGGCCVELAIPSIFDAAKPQDTEP